VPGSVTMAIVYRFLTGIGLATGLAVSVALAGCGSTAPSPLPSTSVDTRLADRDRLAGLAAAAKDKRYVATYTLTTENRPDRTVTAAFATDGTWVVAISGGALSGLADIAIYRSSAGLFQCLVGPTAGTAGTRPDLGPLTPSCVAVAALTPATDPLVQHIFTDWIDPLVDRATALSVAATTLSGAGGWCYSVESNSAALAPPLDPGVYCYAEDGILSGARVGFGTLLLAGTVAAAPPSVAMPAPVVARPPLSTAAPPPPPPPPATPSPPPG
jgi:hypothetical protein